MAIITSQYPQCAQRFFSGHLESMLPSLFRKVAVPYRRFELDTPDDDFLEVDSLESGNSRAVVISHGLEGNSRRHYVASMAKYLNAHGYDVFAWNCRSCGGKMNRQLKMYTHLSVEDLDVVVGHVAGKGYASIYLAGHSMGGNISLNYALSEAAKFRDRIRGVVAVSAPVNLFDCIRELAKWNKRFYEFRFLAKLNKKVALKAQRFGQLRPKAQRKYRTFSVFDNEVTAPLHGFQDAFEYYYKASPSYRLRGLAVPALLLSAQNDPFLGAHCYPVALAEQSEFLHLEMPEMGGHSGFLVRGREESWADIRALEFFDQIEGK